MLDMYSDGSVQRHAALLAPLKPPALQHALISVKQLMQGH
jgi:hypothetical protein